MSARRARTTERIPLKPSTPLAEPVDIDAAPQYRRQRPWYLRPWALIAALVIVGGGATVLVDYPHHETTRDRANEATAVVASVDSSIHECAYAVDQAFSFYEDDTSGVLTTSERSKLPKLVSDDQKACSFSNTTVALLGTSVFGTLTLSSTPVERDLTSMVDAILTWESSYAQASIVDIRALITDPQNKLAAAKLLHNERGLAKEGREADNAVDRVRKQLGTPRVPYPTLPHLPSP
ncbi:MAG: hypothetical protein ACRDXC_13955 [Acidimicrobiales bacterium]